MVEQIVGELVENVIGVEIEAGLGPVPARVGAVRGLRLDPQQPPQPVAHGHAPTSRAPQVPDRPFEGRASLVESSLFDPSL